MVLVQVLDLERGVEVLEVDLKPAVAQQVGLGQVAVDGVLGLEGIGGLVALQVLAMVLSVMAVTTIVIPENKEQIQRVEAHCIFYMIATTLCMASSFQYPPFYPQLSREFHGKRGKCLHIAAPSIS